MNEAYTFTYYRLPGRREAYRAEIGHGSGLTFAGTGPNANTAVLAAFRMLTRWESIHGDGSILDAVAEAVTFLDACDLLDAAEEHLPASQVRAAEAIIRKRWPEEVSGGVSGGGTP